MSTTISSLTFRHDNDCIMAGCPSHVMTAEHQTTSDNFMVKVDGETIIYAGDDNTTRALLKLISEVDY